MHLYFRLKVIVTVSYALLLYFKILTLQEKTQLVVF